RRRRDGTGQWRAGGGRAKGLQDRHFVASYLYTQVEHIPGTKTSGSAGYALLVKTNWAYRPIILILSKCYIACHLSQLKPPAAENPTRAAAMRWWSAAMHKI